MFAVNEKILEISERRPLQIKIAEKIMYARIEQNLTQQELAKKLGVSGAAVTRWERGNNGPKRARLKQLSEALNVPLDYLLDDAE